MKIIFSLVYANLIKPFFKTWTQKLILSFTEAKQL